MKYASIGVNELNETIEGFIKALAEETDEVRRSEAFKAYLDAAARFWRYSFHNQLLICAQKPDATRVAGFRTWNELGRKIKAGSKAIKILAPSVKKAKRRNEDAAEEGFLGGRAVSQFSRLRILLAVLRAVWANNPFRCEEPVFRRAETFICWFRHT